MKRTTLAIFSAGLLAVSSLTACGGGGGSAADFCEAAQEAPNPDPNDIEGSISAMEDLRDQAPDEIRDDLQTMIDALASAQDDPTNVDQEAMMDALQNLTEWEAENCSDDE